MSGTIQPPTELIITGQDSTKPPEVCKVCGDRASGKHYGVVSCDGCRGFFKRSIRKRQGTLYRCKDNNTCIVDLNRRNQCQACRFKKCMDMKMNPMAVQKERSPRPPREHGYSTRNLDLTTGFSRLQSNSSTYICSNPFLAYSSYPGHQSANICYPAYSLTSLAALPHFSSHLPLAGHVSVMPAKKMRRSDDFKLGSKATKSESCLEGNVQEDRDISSTCKEQGSLASPTSCQGNCTPQLSFVHLQSLHTIAAADLRRTGNDYPSNDLIEKITTENDRPSRDVTENIPLSLPLVLDVNDTTLYATQSSQPLKAIICCQDGCPSPDNVTSSVEPSSEPSRRDMGVPNAAEIQSSLPHSRSSAFITTQSVTSETAKYVNISPTSSGLALPPRLFYPFPLSSSLLYTSSSSMANGLRYASHPTFTTSPSPVKSLAPIPLPTYGCLSLPLSTQNPDTPLHPGNRPLPVHDQSFVSVQSLPTGNQSAIMPACWSHYGASSERGLILSPSLSGCSLRWPSSLCTSAVVHDLEDLTGQELARLAIDIIYQDIRWLSAMSAFTSLLPRDRKLLLDRGGCAMMLWGFVFRRRLNELIQYLSQQSSQMENMQAVAFLNFCLRLQGLRQEEYVFLKMISLFNKDVSGLSDPDTVGLLGEQAKLSLRTYLETARPLLESANMRHTNLLTHCHRMLGIHPAVIDSALFHTSPGEETLVCRLSDCIL